MTSSCCSVTLSNGVRMPLIGFGTFRIKGKENIFASIDAALRAGYRSIDSAVIYRNEEDIGLALEAFLPKYNLKRDDVFITSKLSPKDQGFQACLDSVKQSLIALKTEYLDLYLIHWPGASGKKVEDLENSKLRKESWMALEQYYADGKLKAIGVSNYSVHHLEEMKSYANLVPHVLQVEHHPHYNQIELVEYCRKNSIHYQAYSSLGTTVEELKNPLLNDPIISSMAKKYNKTAAQLLLRWSFQQGIGILPKSLNPLHIEENIDLNFTIMEEDMNHLSKLETRRKYAWDPSVVA